MGRRSLCGYAKDTVGAGWRVAVRRGAKVTSQGSASGPSALCGCEADLLLRAGYPTSDPVIGQRHVFAKDDRAVGKRVGCWKKRP